MIDYLNSRIIISLASVSLVAIVVYASLGYADRASRESEIEICRQIHELVSIAQSAEFDSLRLRFPIDNQMIGGAIIELNSSYVLVKSDKNQHCLVFPHPVLIKEFGSIVNECTVSSACQLIISAERDPLRKCNQVFIEKSD